MMKKYILMMLMMLMVSCSTTKQIEFASDTVYVDRERIEYVHRTDSVYLQDSIFVHLETVRDTVIKTVEKYKTKYIKVYQNENMKESKDSIKAVVEYKEKIVYKEKNLFETLKDNVTFVLCLIGLIGLGLIGFKWYKKTS